MAITDVAMPRLALVTVTYNGETVWPEFHASLLAQKGIDWHLIIVDNASSDRTLDCIRAGPDPRITLITNHRNVGVAAANNQGIRLALDHGAEMIVLINNDTVFGPDLLYRLVETADGSDAGAVSPVIPYYDQPDLSWYSGGHFSKARGMLSLHDKQGKPFAFAPEPFGTDYAPTCCVLFKADVFRDIGLMDEAYFVYWDDVDFFWRMKQGKVGTVVDPSAILLHKVSVSTGGRLSDFSIRYGHRNQIYFARKFFGRYYALYVSALMAIVGVVRMAIVGDKWRHLRLRMAAVGEGWRMQLPPGSGE